MTKLQKLFLNITKNHIASVIDNSSPLVYISMIVNSKPLVWNSSLLYWETTKYIYILKKKLSLIDVINDNNNLYNISQIESY